MAVRMKNTSKIIRKADLTKNFSIIPNHIAQSKTLSPNAKSLIIHILSMPDNWYYVKTQFWRNTNLGRNAFNNAWKELEEAGYIQSERIVEGNLVRGYNYIISDSPIFGLTEKRVNQDLDTQELDSNKSNSNKERITKKDLNKNINIEALKARVDSFSDILNLLPNLSSDEQLKIYNQL
jgi:hypothetical protein